MKHTKTIASVIAGAALFATASVVAADSQPVTVDINGNGKALVRGTVEAIGSNSITVKSWGGSWVIRTSGTTEYAPSGVVRTDLKVGDFVGVRGTVATSTALTIDATLVRDWSAGTELHKEKKENHKEVRDIKKEGHESGLGRIFTGVVTDVGSSSFTLKTNNDQTFSVHVASSTKLIGKFFLSLSALSNIQTNDRVWVWGTSASSSITAKIVFDKSR